MKKLIIILVVFSILALTFYLYKNYQYNKIYNNLAFAYGNGRLEATEINIASKLAGKIDDIYVKEGDFVQANQKLAHIETNTLNASKMQALAIVKVKEAELAAAQATVLQKISNLNNAENRYKRAKSLIVKNATSLQTYENDLAIYESAKAELAVAQANVKQAHAAIEAAIADVNRIDVDIKDSTIVAPLKGRIQYRIAEPGEVVSSGGRLLNLVDLTDVYMTFFLPEGTAGKGLIPIHNERDRHWRSLFLFHSFQSQGILGSVQVGVDTSLGKEFLVGAAFGDQAVGNGHDPVGCPDGT